MSIGDCPLLGQTIENAMYSTSYGSNSSSFDGLFSDQWGSSGGYNDYTGWWPPYRDNTVPWPPPNWGSGSISIPGITIPTFPQAPIDEWYENQEELRRKVEELLRAARVGPTPAPARAPEPSEPPKKAPSIDVDEVPPVSPRRVIAD